MKWSTERKQSTCSMWLQIVLLGTHGARRLFCFLMPITCLRQLEFWAGGNILDQLECNFFPGYACCALPVFFPDRNSCLRKLEFWAYANIVDHLDCRMFSYAQLMCFLFSFVTQILPEPVRILSLCKYYKSAQYISDCPSLKRKDVKSDNIIVKKYSELAK